MNTLFRSIIWSIFLLIANTSMANNLLIQNVTTLNDNPSAQTIQVQFDISWENSWHDSINWDAVWIWMKFQDPSGVWQHAKLNTNGFNNGTGTANTITVPSDQVGAFIYRTNLGSGTFNATNVQLQWNYGLSGLSNVTNLEVRVFGVEMVYIPEGDFNVAKRFIRSPDTFNASNNSFFESRVSKFYAPGDNFPVIDERMTPNLVIQNQYNNVFDNGFVSSSPVYIDTVRVKGNAGIDTNLDGIIDYPNYPTGYTSFYCYKYELTEQQYADFLNTLDSTQIANLGLAGSNITLVGEQYYSSTPTVACGVSNANRLFAYSDWSGVRPMTLLEFNKTSYGPLQPIKSTGDNGINYRFKEVYPAWGTSVANSSNHYWSLPLVEVTLFSGSATSREQTGASYYGVMGLTGNANEPTIRMNHYTYTHTHGNGVLTSNGLSDIPTWQNVEWIDMIYGRPSDNSGVMQQKFGFRYVRSAP